MDMSVEKRLRKLSDLAFIYNAYKLKVKVDLECREWDKSYYPYETVFVVRSSNKLLSHVFRGNKKRVNYADDYKNLKNYQRRVSHYEKALEELDEFEIHIGLCYVLVRNEKTGKEMSDEQWAEWQDIIEEENRTLNGILNETIGKRNELSNKIKQGAKAKS